MPRAREFDEDALMDAAIELFWVHGYRAASLTDLSGVTGVGNGSLYQAYGSKWSLFLTAFRLYCARRVELVQAALDGARGGTESTVVTFFDAIVDDCASYPDRRGCLMVNSISELGSDADVAAIASEAIRQMESAMEVSLAEAAGRPSSPELATTAAQVISLSQALIQLARVGRDDDDLRRIGRQTAAQISRSLHAA